MVYLAMSYLYGTRYVGPINSTILSLRRELYTIPYHHIDWDLARNQCAKEDLYYPHPLVQDILWKGLHKIAEPLLMQWPLSKIKDYLWLAEDGKEMTGYNGSQVWDVSFGIRAILATNLPEEYGVMLKNAHNFIKASQVREDSSGDVKKWYRQRSRGGWPFSTVDNGWIVSDCTAEALK
ncbi:hypothetical protein HAX54_047276, partial [Datura stramonium]|nr:hypothetical protein [Datura stramonium]